MAMKKYRKFNLFFEYIRLKGNLSLTASANKQDEKTAAELARLYSEISQISVPEPSEAMKDNFFKDLKSFELNSVASDHLFDDRKSVLHLFQNSSYLKIAATVILFVLGYLTGYLMNRQSEETTKLLGELQHTQETLMLTLLEQPSATDRLKAVSLSHRIGGRDRKIADALLSTLNHDSNINVRLSTIDVLLSMADDPNVRIGLVQSINKQESPLIQNALADAMVYLNEKSSVKQLEMLLDRNNLDSNVRLKVTKSIQTLTKI